LKYFVTSDLHLNHYNIIRYCGRPFKSLTHMNEELIRRWNERVKNEDVVYVIGDFCFKNTPAMIYRGEGGIEPAKYWEDMLNGKITHIIGNHDRNNSVKSRIKSLQIYYSKMLINLVHNPAEANYNYQLNLVGHIHQNWKFQRKMIDRNKLRILINVGVDVHNYRPVTLQEIMKLYQQIKKGLVK